jgi:hypothetical protein
MTAASRLQKAAFPQLRRPPSKNLQWGRPANSQPDLDHPRQRPERATCRAPDAQREG